VLYVHPAMTSTPWREDPALRGCFHEEFADDLRVFVHEGGPRTTRAQPELMWVRLDAFDSVTEGGNVYRGELLNEPHQLASLKQGDEVLVLACATAPHPIRVTRKYLAEMRDYQVITPCNRCGFAELFDAPSDLLAAIFPTMKPEDVMMSFTSFCPLCGGVQMVCSTAADVPQESAPAPPPAPTRRWWELWKRQ